MSELKNARIMAEAAILLASHYAADDKWREWARGWLAGNPTSRYAPRLQPEWHSPAIQGLCAEVNYIVENLQAAESAADPSVVSSRIADVFAQAAYAINLAKNIGLGGEK
jgi:hypothetical protein